MKIQTTKSMVITTPVLKKILRKSLKKLPEDFQFIYWGRDSKTHKDRWQLKWEE